MELKLGKISSNDIATWFNISYNTYRRNKQKYLTMLKEYCVFEEVYGGIIISEIFLSKYDKKMSKNMDTLFLKEIVQANDNLSTVAGMTRKYKTQFNEKVSDKTISRHFTKSRDKLFGDEVKKMGIMGSRDYVWAVKLSQLNEYRLLTKKEEEIFDSLILSVYGDTDLKKLKGSMALDKLFRESEMTKEEYLTIKEQKGYNFYVAIIDSFKIATGLQLVNVNKYEIEQRFDLTEEEESYRKILLKEIKGSL